MVDRMRPLYRAPEKDGSLESRPQSNVNLAQNQTDLSNQTIFSKKKKTLPPYWQLD
jgi:hypothetical protein